MTSQSQSSKSYVKAFSPGSATLFFIPNRYNDALKKGSQGVAICIESGMNTRIEPSEELEVRFNGIPLDKSIQEEVAKRLKFKGKIYSTSELPPSSGFGLSAAAALTTIAAIKGNYARIGEIYKMAHQIEIKRGTGLGDVQSQISGGLHIRIKGGSFPYSITERILVKDTELLVLPFKKKVPTGEIISSETIVKKIIKNGKESLKEFIKRPTLENGLNIGRKFAVDSELVSPNSLKILEDLDKIPSSVSLIGDSIISIYNDEAYEILRKYGNPIITKISRTGLTIY